MIDQHNDNNQQHGRIVIGLLLLCLNLIPMMIVDAFSVAVSLPPPRSSSSSSCLFMISSSSSSSQLSSLTVKELRQLVKESSSTERGTLSKLKRKQDLIDYLVKRAPDEQKSEEEEDVDEVVASTAAAAEAEATRKEQEDQSSVMKLGSMPPLVAAGAATTSVSPKEAIFEKVYQRYPPLREIASTLEITSVGHGVTGVIGEVMAIDEVTGQEHDVRQIFHPMLKRESDNSDSASSDIAGESASESSSASSSSTPSSDIDVVFVGTASCMPGTTRGVSCTALRLLNGRNRQASFGSSSSSASAAGGGSGGGEGSASKNGGGTWLFDVGECTQLQVQRTSAIRPSKITKIFLTHAHGDHTFGLPGLLCLMGQDRENRHQPVDIYGPEGLRMWLRVAIRYSVSRIVPPYRVHEIMDVPMAPEWEFNPRSRRYYYKGLRGRSSSNWGDRGLAGEDPVNWISQVSNHGNNIINLQPSSLYGEVDGGRDIYPIYDHPQSHDGAPVWEIINGDNDDNDKGSDIRVYAAPMSHGIPCLGYVVNELPRPGRLRSEIVEPIVRRNVGALKKAGFAVPMKAMAVIKNMSPGSSFTFPDGTVVKQEDAVEKPRKGRKIVYCGDTADSRALLNLAQNADVVVHECTNAYLPGIDSKSSSFKEVTRDAVVHGHSTPQIAASFCLQANAKRLVLNHFSPRYKGDLSVDSLSIMQRIEQQAMKSSGLSESHVAAAWDFMILPIPSH